jgi:hypothetical protein
LTTESDSTPSGRVVPYVAPWSTEREMPASVIASPTGIAFVDEVLGDRDERGVLWKRMPSRPGHGRPLLGQMHSLRQRKAMRRLWCSVCAGPADRTDEGVLWLLPDRRSDWPDWPNRMGVTEPPVCLPCARLAIGACPALHDRYAAFRAGRFEISGVYGIQYRGGRSIPNQAQLDLVHFDDPRICWTLAVQLVRQLTDCTFVDL